VDLESYKKRVIELEGENEKLIKQINGLKRAVGKWRLRFSGEKGINQKVDKRSTSINSINININKVKDFKVKIIVDSDIPTNMSIKEVKNLVENMTAYDVFPELGKENKYVIKEAYCNNQNQIWNIVLVG
jgi:predicted RNase H-like nuclease (RuvC/YqgF family)